MILAELIRDGKLVKTREFEGKMSGDYFQLKRQWKTDFRFLIVWLIGDSSVKLALNENNELVVLRQSGGVALLFIAPIFGTDSPVFETYYKRLE